MYSKTIHLLKIIKTLFHYLLLSFGFRKMMQIIVSILIVHCSKFGIGIPVQSRKNNININLKSKNNKNTKENKTKEKS